MTKEDIRREYAAVHGEEKALAMEQMINVQAEIELTQKDLSSRYQYELGVEFKPYWVDREWSKAQIAIHMKFLDEYHGICDRGKQATLAFIDAADMAPRARTKTIG